MCKRVRVAAALFVCPLILAACGLGARPDGLPAPPEEDTDGPPSGSQITGNGPLTTLRVHGPARIDVKEFQFQEAGQETVVDLERSSAERIADLSYDHFTGELKPINRATVSLYDKDDGWLEGEPDKRSDYPSEQECRGKRAEGREVFSKDDLKANFSIFCIKTAEDHDGFLFVRPVAGQKPDAYYVYTYIWVR